MNTYMYDRKILHTVSIAKVEHFKRVCRLVVRDNVILLYCNLCSIAGGGGLYMSVCDPTS